LHWDLHLVHLVHNRLSGGLLSLRLGSAASRGQHANRAVHMTTFLSQGTARAAPMAHAVSTTIGQHVILSAKSSTIANSNAAEDDCENGANTSEPASGTCNGEADDSTQPDSAIGHERAVEVPQLGTTDSLGESERWEPTSEAGTTTVTKAVTNTITPIS